MLYSAYYWYLANKFFEIGLIRLVDFYILIYKTNK